MYHFFEYIYIGCYYADFLCESTAKKTLRPILKCLLILLYQIPFLKDRLALQGLSPEQAIAKVFRLGDRLDAIDYLGLREAHIGYMLCHDIVAITDRNGNPVSDSNLEIHVQSLGADEDYWLDTGSFEF